MAWGSVDVDEQRMRFVIAASRQDRPFRQLCQCIPTHRTLLHHRLVTTRLITAPPLVSRGARAHWVAVAQSVPPQVAGNGQIWIDGRRWEISRALAGEWVQLIRLGQRILVYYCRSLVRELDQLSHRSFAGDRWLSWS